MKKLGSMIPNFKREERGQGMVEYALILSLVSVVAIGVLTGLGGGVLDTFGTAAGALGNAP